MSAKSHFNFNATPRVEIGKKAVRELREQQKIPAIVYGGDEKPQAITLEQNEVMKALSHEAVFSHILNLKIDGKTQKVILKALERHQTKPHVTHIDFYRIKAGEKITMHIPLHFLDQEKSPGVKEGGVVSHMLNDIEVRCLPEHLPEYIEVDLSTMEMNQLIHLSEIKLPQGVELVEPISPEHNPSLASVHRPRVEEESVAEEVVPEEGAKETETAATDVAKEGEPPEKQNA